MAAHITWRGLDEFDAALDAMVARVEASLSAAVAEAAHTIEAGAKSRAPVVTGTLRRSVYVDGPKATPGEARARVGPTVIYGRRIELGFHGPDRRGRVYNQDGNPYLEPAVSDVGPRLSEIFTRHWAAAVGGA